MKRFFCFLMAVALFSMAGCDKEDISGIMYTMPPATEPVPENEPLLTLYELTMRRDLLCMMMAYPEFVTGVEKKQDGKVYAVLQSGGQILYDDGKTKSFDQKIRDADIQDMMEQIYPLSDVDSLQPEDFDPGRFRVYALLNEVYGADRQQIQSKLKNVKTGAGSFLFNESGGASEALKAVLDEIGPLAESQKRIGAYVYPMGGTFNYRVIAGTNLLSAHAYGIAIDLVSRKQDYWKWSSRQEGEKRIAAYPKEIVRIFEKHGFIWGGKWGHFDIMHYEFRPELILKALYFSEEAGPEDEWYGSILEKESGARKYIEMIEDALSK